MCVFNMQATMLGEAASEEDRIARLASSGSILPLFTVAEVRNATRAKPHDFLSGCVQVAIADPPPSAHPVQRLGVAPKVVLARRYRPPAPEEPRKRAAPALLPAAPPPKTAGGGPPRDTANKENMPPQKKPKMKSQEKPKARAKGKVEVQKRKWANQVTL